MTRSLVAASLVGFFAAPAFAAADPASTTDATGSTVVGSDDGAPDASAGARGGGGGGRGGGARGGGGGGGGSHAGGGKGGHSGGGHASGGHGGGKGHGGSHAGDGHGRGHASAPRAGQTPAANQHAVSNHPGRAPAPSSRAPAHAPARAVANKTVHPGSAPRAMHHPAAGHPGHYAPAHYHSVIFPRWRPSYGVFIYSPPPARRMVGGVDAGPSDDPRAVNRNGDLGIGFVAGSYMSTYRGGYGSYGDFGMGLNLTWRPTEAVGFEGAWTRHMDSWDEDVSSERVSDVFSGSMKLYAMPWTRVAPYLSVGVTGTQRQFEDTYSDGFSTQTETVDDTLVGPHIGLGVELAVGRSAAFDFEGRAVGYMNKLPDDPAAPFAFQATGGLKLYF